ncbi:MAG TPA: hypothetical protein VIW29_08685 [Polyangiaceae bacterium]
MILRARALSAGLLAWSLQSDPAGADEPRPDTPAAPSEEPRPDTPAAPSEERPAPEPAAPEPPKVTPAEAPAPNDSKRQLPDYDGRGGTPQTPGQKALWVPRILLSPLYFVSEFVIRRPLGFAITAAEKAELPAALYDFFAFGPDHKSGIVPYAFINFGFEPIFGLYAFWDDAGFEGHDLRLRGQTSGAHSLTASVVERFHLTSTWDLTLTATATRRPDYTFYGIGWDAREEDLLRYASDTIDAHMETRWTLGESLVEIFSGYRSATFADTEYDRESVHDAIAGGKIAAPPGYADGYQAPFVGSRVVFDSRKPGGSNTGVRLDLGGEQGTDFRNSPTSAWIRYGASVGALYDLTDGGRVVSLSLTTLFADPIGDRDVPFTELIELGGPRLMPGFRDSRLVDSSAAVLTLRYSWPIWIWLNGSLQAAVGNVYGKHLEDFSLERSRFSGAVGIESHDSRDAIFQALLGVGTEPFVSGAQLNSIRFTIGARRGF